MELTKEQVAAVKELMTIVARAGHCPMRGGGLPCGDCWGAVQEAVKTLHQLTGVQLDPYDKVLPVCGKTGGARVRG